VADDGFPSFQLPDDFKVDDAGEGPVSANGLLFMDKSRLLVATLFEAIHAATPLAVHPSDEVWIYDHGCYRPDRRRLVKLVADRLGDHFKPEHVRNVTSYAGAALAGMGRVLSDHATSHLVNVINGMLDPVHWRPDPARSWGLVARAVPGRVGPRRYLPELRRLAR
jgi:hypothetical protein